MESCTVDVLVKILIILNVSGNHLWSAVLVLVENTADVSVRKVFFTMFLAGFLLVMVVSHLHVQLCSGVDGEKKPGIRVVCMSKALDYCE